MTDTPALGSLVRGSLWVTAAEALGVFATGLVSVVAARVISPREFGLVGAVVLATSLLEAPTQSGFDRALTQRRAEVTEFLDVAFTWQVVRGAVLMLALIAVAPFLARVYDEAALVGLALLLAPCLLLRGLQNTAVVGLARRLDFRAQFKMRLAQAVVSALLSLPVLFVFRNGWGLAARNLIAALVAALVSFLVVPYRPRLVWDLGRLRELFRYGRWVTASTLIVFVITKGDDLFVSKKLGLEALGIYQMAYWLSNLPATHVSHILARATFPVFARLQDDREQLRRAFMLVLGGASFVACPAAAFLFIGAEPLVEHVLGDRWIDAAQPVRWLALAGLLRAIAGTGGSLFQAIGRPDLELKQNLPRFVLLATLIWPLSEAFGLVGACIAVLVALLPALVVWRIALGQVLGVTTRELCRLLAPAFGSACLLGAALWLALRLVPTGAVGALATVSVAAVIVWAALLVFLTRILRWPLLDNLAGVAATLRGRDG